MMRALVVEDSEKWQNFHRDLLGPVLGEGDLDVVDNYDDAISMLGGDYLVYVLDVQFPKIHGGKKQLLGVQLAQDIKQREGSYDKIAIVSSGGHMSAKARDLGINKIYNKFSLDEDETEVAAFSRDLQSLFSRHFFDDVLVKMHQDKILAHSLMLVLYGGKIPQYCVPMPRNPEPDINIPVHDFSSIYRNALMLNKTVEDGAVMIKLPERLGEDNILTGWSYSLFAPPLNLPRRVNCGSAYNSSLNFSGMVDVKYVYLVNSESVLRFEDCIENILYEG